MVKISVLHELWDTTRMRLLVEIERQGTLSAAAAAIGIGQPSASQHLRLKQGRYQARDEPLPAPQAPVTAFLVASILMRGPPEYPEDDRDRDLDTTAR
jgi:hypothetical protein